MPSVPVQFPYQQEAATQQQREHHPEHVAHPPPEENEQKGDYTVYFYASPGTTYGSINFNYSHKDPFYREQIWQMLKERQRLNLTTLSDKVLCAIDLALWDARAKQAGKPVHELLGGPRW